MSRIRSIKPEFFTSEQLVECSPNARLLFVGMWCFCDDGGVHPASAKRLKMEVFPGDSFTDEQVQTMVDELIANGLISEFEAESQRFWHVTSWAKHQKIDKPTIRYPRPDPQNSTSIRRGLGERSTTPRDGAETSGTERRRAESSRMESKGPEGDFDEDSADTSPGDEKVQSKKPARKPSGKKGPPTLSHVTADMLRDPAKLLAWFDRQAKIHATEENRRWTIAAACKASDPATKAKSPVALFVSLAKDLAKGDHSKIGDGHYDAAKLRLRELRLKQEHGITSTGPRTLAEGLADE